MVLLWHSHIIGGCPISFGTTWSTLHVLILYVHILMSVLLCSVPADVFSLNSGWAGFYEYLGKRQAATITVNAFNGTTSRVNVTLLEQSGVQIKLSGELQLYHVLMMSYFLLRIVLCCFNLYDEQSEIMSENGLYRNKYRHILYCNP